MLFSVPALVLGRWIPSFLSGVLFFAANFVIWVQFTHAAAHGKWSGNSFVKNMQKLGLFVKPAVHNLHHTQYDCNFCILTGWANPVINVIFSMFIVPHISPHMLPEAQQGI